MKRWRWTTAMKHFNCARYEGNWWWPNPGTQTNLGTQTNPDTQTILVPSIQVIKHCYYLEPTKHFDWQMQMLPTFTHKRCLEVSMAICCYGNTCTYLHIVHQECKHTIHLFIESRVHLSPSLASKCVIKTKKVFFQSTKNHQYNLYLCWLGGIKWGRKIMKRLGTRKRVELA